MDYIPMTYLHLPFCIEYMQQSGTLLWKQMVQSSIKYKIDAEIGRNSLM